MFLREESSQRITLREFPENNMNTEHTIWVEKYRPTSFDTYIGNATTIKAVSTFIKDNYIPHMIFHGSTGTGKTSLAKLIVNSLNCDFIYINASDENNVETVRTKIKEFASNVGFSELKVVFLDEADYLTHNSQAALRNLIETYSLTTRFIFTCNYLEKMSSPILSRCQQFHIEPMSKKDVAIYLKKILDVEKISYTIEDLGKIVNAHYPDIRKVLNFAQQNSIGGKLEVATVSGHSEVKDTLIKYLVNNSDAKKTFVEIRQLVADSGSRHYEELYQTLYDGVEKFSPKNQTEAILIIAEYLYQNSLVVNKEITFMACIAKLLDIL